MTKKDLLEAIKKIVVVLLILFGLYCIIVRFKYPELTETQLFLKVFCMTQRERDILKASVSWTDKSLTVNEEKAFQAGAEWADRTMIDKATEWLFANVYDYLNHEDQERVESFRKAMEE